MSLVDQVLERRLKLTEDCWATWQDVKELARRVADLERKVQSQGERSERPSPPRVESPPFTSGAE